MKKLLLLLFSLVLFQVNAQKINKDGNTQEVLTNQSIIDLTELGFEEQVIIDKIESSETNFDTSIDALKILKEKKVNSSIISVMIKSGKNLQADNQLSKPDKPTYPKKNGDIFYALNGYEELVKVNFQLAEELEGMNESLIRESIIFALNKAQRELKNPLSFVPKSVYISRESDFTNTLFVQYYGKNAYGAEEELGFVYKFGNKTLSELKKNYDNFKYDESIENKREYIFKKMYSNGMKSPLKGEVTIAKNYVEIRYNPFMGVETPPSKIPILNSVDTSLEKWSFESSEGGIQSILRFDSDSKKYKSDGGLLILVVDGMTVEFPLIKIK